MRKSLLMASVASIALATIPMAYANANAGGKLFFCVTPQPADLDQTAYEALLWLEVKNMGNFGESGSNTNILTYDEWGTDVIQKSKGITDAGSPTVECARVPTDPGQIALRDAALTNFNYATKIEKNDKATPAGTPTIVYNRGLVTGPTRPNGRNEDFDLEVFTFAFNQREIVVDPT